MDNSTDSSTSGGSGDVSGDNSVYAMSGNSVYIDTDGATGGSISYRESSSSSSNDVSYDNIDASSTLFVTSYYTFYLTCNLEKQGYTFVGWQVTNSTIIRYGTSSTDYNEVSKTTDFTYLITDTPTWGIGVELYFGIYNGLTSEGNTSVEDGGEGSADAYSIDESEQVSANSVTPLFTALWEREIEVEYDSEGDCWFFEDGYMPQEYVGSTTPSGVDESAASGAYTVRLTSSSFAQVLVYAGTEADYALVTIGNVSGWFELEPIRWIVCYGSTLDTSVTTAVTEQVVTAGFIYSNAGTSFSWAMSSVLGMSVETLEASLELTNAAVGEFAYDSFSGTLAQLAVNEDSTTLESKIAVSSTDELDALGGKYTSTCTDFVAFLMSSGSNTIGGATEEYWTRDLVADLDSSSAYYSSTNNTYTYNGALNNGVYVTASGTLNNAKLSNRMGARLTMSLNGTVKEKYVADTSWMTSEFEFPFVLYEDQFGYYYEVCYIQNLEDKVASLGNLTEEELQAIFPNCEITEKTDEDGNISYEITAYLKNADGSTDAVTSPVLGISIPDTTLFTSMAEGYDYAEAVSYMMANIVYGVVEGEEKYRETYYLLAEVLASVQAAIDEALEESGQEINVIYLDESGNEIDEAHDASPFEDWVALSYEFLSVSIYSADALEESESLGENLYYYDIPYMQDMNEASSMTSIYEMELDVGTLGEDFDFENYNLSFVFYDPSTAVFYVIPVTEDMFDTESQTLTMDFPCTGTGMFYYYPV